MSQEAQILRAAITSALKVKVKIQFIFGRLLSQELYTIENFFNTLRKSYLSYLFAALSSSPCTYHEFTKFRNFWIFGTVLDQRSEVDGERVFWPAYTGTGQRRTF